MLRAGMMAAGQMNIDRRVERRRASRTSARSPRRGAWCRTAANLQPVLPVQATRPERMALASIARPSASIRALRRREILGRRRRRSADSARPSAADRRRRVRAAIAASPRICATDIRPTGTTTPIQFSPPASAGERRYARCDRTRDAAQARQAPRDRIFGRAFPRAARRNFSTPMASSTYFSRALVRSVRSPCSMKTRTTASATLQASFGCTSTPVSRAKSWWPVMPPRQSLNQTPGSKPEAVVHLHRLEADVVGVLQHGDRAGAVEGDVEFARQAVKRAIVEDVEVPFARKGPRVDQLLRIDAGGRRAGDVADIVGAGAARAQPEILDRLDHGDRVAWPRFRGSADWRASSHGRSRRHSVRRDRPRRRTAPRLRMPFGMRSRHM